MYLFRYYFVGNNFDKKLHQGYSRNVSCILNYNETNLDFLEGFLIKFMLPS